MAHRLMLPEPVVGDWLGRALSRRRSTKRYSPDPITLREAGAALHAAAGTANGHRAVPSARSTYPVRLSLVAGAVTGLPPGAYQYDPEVHGLTLAAAGDQRRPLASATLDAPWLADCPVLLLLSADLTAARARFTDQPPDHGERFVWIEAGHAAQNVYHWAAIHQLGTVLIAGLDDIRARRVTRDILPEQHQLLGILAVGHPDDGPDRPGLNAALDLGRTTSQVGGRRG